MQFTIYNDRSIDKKILDDLEYISKRVKAIIKGNLHSIMACGGFGRGEGSVVTKNGRIHIVNDYDLNIVLDTKNSYHYVKLFKKYHASIERLAELLADELDIKQVDLSLKPLFYFSNPKILRIENYEINKGHLLLYGNDDPTDLMPDWRAEDIPLFEGTWLFRNRGAGMLIPALYFSREGGIPEEKKENFVIECNKAQLAMGDSILLLNGLYHHLYSERLRRIDDLDISDIPEGRKILDNYRGALEQKLRPDFSRFYQFDLIDWWFEIKELMDSFFRFFEIKRLKSKFDDWIEYAHLRKPEDVIDIKTFVGNVIRNKINILSLHDIQRLIVKSRRYYTINLVPLLLFSFGIDGYYSPYIIKASELLGEQLNGEPKTDWLNLVKSFLNELHPGGEVVNAIRLCKI